VKVLLGPVIDAKQREQGTESQGELVGEPVRGLGRIEVKAAALIMVVEKNHKKVARFSMELSVFRSTRLRCSNMAATSAGAFCPFHDLDYTWMGTSALTAVATGV